MAAPTTILVTGAGRGLGKETARQLARRGCRVVLAARREEDALAARPPGDHLVLQLDVTSSDHRARAAELAAELGGLDGVVHNAGVALTGFDAAVVRRTLEVNVHAPRQLHAWLVPHLKPGARVVMVSSGMGELAVLGRRPARWLSDPALDEPGLVALAERFAQSVQAGIHGQEGWPSSAYRVSKGMLNALTRILAARHPDLRINAVCPGWVRTRMGGIGATRAVDEGASGIAWAATLPPDGPTGGFFRDGEAIDW
jgi:carbonyl reductase 1